ncbi:hypothetical protein EV127DRAFT_475202 [Xylaria flabelliformis]|nr:hypothetical protein EV127DRAFT_475202 [Xylaria flabelliformis]
MIQFDFSRQTGLRRACDRCHHAKLKCSKEIDEEKCQRCLRANVECTFSPAATTPRRQKWSVSTLTTSNTRYRGRELVSNTAQPDNSPHEEDNTQCTYSNGDADLGTACSDALEFANNSTTSPEGNNFMDIDECENPPLPVHETNSLKGTRQIVEEHFPTQGLSGVRQSPDPPVHHLPSNTHPFRSRLSPNLASDTHSRPIENHLGESTSRIKETEHTRTLWMRRITDVNIALTEHLDLLSDDNVSGDFVGSRQKEELNSAFTIDRAFHLSQLFIDILGNICLKLPASDKGDEVTNKSQQASFQLDPSAELLIFSAYLRLLETYHRILESVQAAAKQNHLESSTATFQLPSLTVGSFSLSSKSNTQFFVLVNLTETMARKARRLITEMSSPKITPGYRGDFQSFGGVSLVIVPDLALRAIRAREEGLFRMIEDLKNSIL